MATRQYNINGNVFYSWIAKTFSPTSLVFASPKAQTIIGKNSLSPSQFLRPFGDLSGTQLNFSYNEKYQNIITDFKIDFYDPQDFTKKGLNQMNNFIINCLSEEKIMPTFDKNFRKINKNNINQFVLQLNQFYPYFSEFEKLYFELCKFQETELYQQPLIIVYICDINDDIDIINVLLQKSLPKLILSEAYERSASDLIILLNDENDNNDKNYNKISSESNFKNKYKTDIITIDINSGNADDLSNDIWSQYIHKIEEYSDGFEPIKRGQYITNKEVNLFREKFRNYIDNKFRPALLKLINKIDRDLDKNSGINSLFKKLKGNKNETKEYLQGYNILKLSSIEKQRYFLAVLLFHIRDYWDAYENLKKLKDSIKGKNKDYENAIRQFLVICRYLKKDDKSKIDTLDPYSYYLDNKQDELAARNILLYIKMAEKVKQNHIIDKLYKYNLNKPKVKYFKGLIYEKIGFYHLFSEHPKIRKFALNDLIYTTDRYLKEREEDIRSSYLIQNFGYICDLFKIDYDYSKFDNDVELYTFSMIKKYVFVNLCSACDATNNFKFGIPLFTNYLRLILLELNDETKTENIFEEKNETEEIDLYFQKLNAMLIKGKIDYLDNFPIPIIEDSSLVFYIEQDQRILKENNKTNLNFVKSFEKYLELSVEQKYSVLSDEDISCLRYLDEQSSRNFSSNYFMKTVNNIKVGEQIFIKFNISNTLNINLSINNLTLIITNKSADNNLVNKTNNEAEYTCGFYDFELPSKRIHSVAMKLVFNTSGLFEISGLTMTLFKNINVRYFFNKKTINTLYLNKNHFKENFTKYVRDNFCFNVIESIKSLSINVNNDSSKMIFLQNQINYLSIKIHNNNNEVEIRKYTIFLEADNNVLLYPKYLHKQYLTPTNTVLIPIIGMNIGECKLKIIIKYEEKSNKSTLDLYRNVLNVKVFKGINLNIEDKIYEYNKSVNRRLIIINMDVLKSMNKQSISFSKNKSIIVNKEKFMIEPYNENNNNDIENNIIDLQDKNINHKLIVKLISKENESENYSHEQMLDELIGKKKREDQNNYPHIKEFFKDKFCNENNLILKYKINIMDNNGVNSLNCLYKHEIKINKIPYMNKYYVNNSYLKNNLTKFFNMNYDVEDFEDNQKYITINISLLNNDENFEKIGNIIEYIEIKVDNTDNNFEWVGLYATKIKNVLDKNETENKKTFNCLIDNKSRSLSDKKNEINLNHFIFLIKIKNSSIIYQYTNFPYSIYYNRE